MNQKKFSLQKTSYYIFIFLVIAVPLALYRNFDNSLEFVKSEVLKIIGGLFIITSSSYLISSGHKDERSQSKITFQRVLDPFVILLIVASILSALFSISFRTSYYGSYDRQIGLLTYLYLFLIYLLLPTVIDSSRKLTLVIRIIEISAVIIALMCMLEYFGVRPIDLRPRGFKRPVSTIGHPIFSAGFLVVVFPFALLNVTSIKSVMLRVAIPAIIAVGIVTTQTRTAYVALSVEIVLLALLYTLTSKERKIRIRNNLANSFLLLFGLIFLSVILALLFPENVFVRRLLSISRISEQPRWFLWRDSMSMFIHYPFTGTGIGTFSRAFEDFASYELRYSEIRVYFDNAHNNFINTFCTMGALGGTAYVLLLFQVMRLSFKNLLSHKNSSVFRTYSLAFLAFISGYVVFGLADFDDLNLLFYFFVFLALFKIVLKNFSQDYISKDIVPKRSAILGIAVVFILFSVYNIYVSINEISAQESFSRGLEKYSAGDIAGFATSVTNAIRLNPYEPYYRYEYASRINVYCSGLTKNEAETKNKLLQSAKEQVIEAEASNGSRLNCLALRSLIELEMGNEQEAFRIRDELYRIDSTQFPYRLNLAVYYFNLNKDSLALREINTVLSRDIKNVNALTAMVMYLMRTNQKDKAAETCRKILGIEPENKFALRMLESIKK